MVLPDSFSPWEHLQSVLLQSYNRVVREEFRDVGDDNWDAEITTPRSSLRVACTLEDSDSIPQTLIRMMLFYFVLRKASDLQMPVYGIPTDTYQQSVKFRPQVRLYFLEDFSDTEPGYAPIDAEVSFRLFSETTTSLTEANVLALANKIRSVFGTGNGYRWQKGRLKVSYKDLEHGYNCLISSYSESEARQLLVKVLEIQNHTLNDEFLTVSQLQQNPPIVPQTELILGQQRRLPRKRPVGWVRFRHAELHIWGMPNPVTLVDLSGSRRTALIRG